MRRRLIRFALPLIFCVVPLLAALLVAVSLPPDARNFYVKELREHGSQHLLDGLILGLGGLLFGVQTVMSWRALQWRGQGFDERPDRWISNLAQAAEWFPLLGLLGTVGGILQTFSSISITGPTAQAVIITKYAPALTATGSGLFMALINILPAWVVLIGRDLILALAGGEASAEGAAKSYPAAGSVRR
jgi:hypothetical protein